MTQKQKKAIQLASENGGNISKAMREAGYSEVSSKTPKKLTESKAWLELMEDALPDEALLNTLKEGLVADKVISARIVGADASAQTDDFIDVPDHPTRHKFLETALKLKKRLGPDSQTLIQSNVQGDMQIEIL